MPTPIEVVQEVIKELDSQVKTMSNANYRQVLNELLGELEVRLEALDSDETE